MARTGAGAAEAQIHFDGQQLLPLEVELGAGAVTIEVTNEAAEEIVFIAERDAWGTQGASAALVTSLEEFRHLFASEVLAPGIEVAVRSLTVLFSDLKGSTRIYVDIGDSPAYRLVRDHFDVILPVVKRHRGRLVKTIGDAVMAVFLAPVDGITAALEIQRELEQVNLQHPDRPRLHAKLGLHAGPCVAINANGMLDYFGSTVNLASRVHARSSGRDVVITREMLDDPDVRRIVADPGLAVERFKAELAGFSEAYELVRISPANP
jgi:class 3 adenylate cyclase